MSDERQIEKQAIAWFTRMNGRPSATDREDFARWLAASAAHEQHYADVQRLWTDLGPLADAVEIKRRVKRPLASGAIEGTSHGNGPEILPRGQDRPASSGGVSVGWTGVPRAFQSPATRHLFVTRPCRSRGSVVERSSATGSSCPTDPT